MTAGADVEQLIAEYGATHALEQAALLDLLHLIQHHVGYVSEAAQRQVADALNLSRADVYGFVSFYPDYRTAAQPPCVEVCNAEACQALGSAMVLDAAEQACRAAGGRVATREVFCLGNCATGPSVRVGDSVYGRVAAAAVRELVAARDPRA